MPTMGEELDDEVTTRMLSAWPTMKPTMKLGSAYFVTQEDPSFAMVTLMLVCVPLSNVRRQVASLLPLSTQVTVVTLVDCPCFARLPLISCTTLSLRVCAS